MNPPPPELDGAKVLEWAWSGTKPFGIIRYASGDIAAQVFGLAICQYQNSEEIYRFSCNAEWETQQDSTHRSVTEAKENLPKQYQKVEVIWQEYE